jgi:hypothetical protein
LIVEQISREWRKLKSRPKEHPYAVLLERFSAKSSKDAGGRGKSVADFANKIFLVGAVEGAKALGLKGPNVFQFSAYYLGTLGIPYAPSSVKKLYYKLRDRFQMHASVIDYWVDDMVEPLLQFRKDDETPPA